MEKICCSSLCAIEKDIGADLIKSAQKHSQAAQPKAEKPATKK